MRSDAYRTFALTEGARLRASTPLTLTEADLQTPRGLNENVSLDELADIYLPLSRLLNLHVRGARNLYSITDTFLGRPIVGRPYIVALAGSVAVGKSTFARVLQAILARWPGHPSVDLVTTDGSLYPLRMLYFDFSIYLDADTADIEAWYLDRFMLLRRTACQNPASHFHPYKDLGPEEARAAGRRIWSEINAVNLRENILPTRERAHVVLRKGPDHAVSQVALRQL